VSLTRSKSALHLIRTWRIRARGKASSRASPSLEGYFRVHLLALPDHKSSGTGPTPDDSEEEGLLEYAEKCAALADFADLDLTADDSDFDDLSPDVPRQTYSSRHMWQISDMDVS
jgi:hypothetical protein